MKKIDAIIAMAIGAITGLYFYDFLSNARNTQTGINLVPEPYYSLLWLIILIFPFLAAFCLWVASLIGKKFISIYQLAKFLLIGIMATILDLGLLNVFLAATGKNSGYGYAAFKGISFIFATIVKYIPDKYWAFKKKEGSDIKKEFGQFFAVTAAGLAINVAMASIIVNYIGPQFGLDAETWGKIGGIGATIAVFAWNFVGYKFIVFKK